MGKYGKHRALVGALAGVAAGTFAAPAAACRLALVLAIDVSSSVDAAEDVLQRQGLAAALQKSDVAQAFFNSPDPVAIAAFEWAGRDYQQMILPWVTIHGQDELTFAARAIAASTRGPTDLPTAVGFALAYASALLQDRPDCLFHTIDVAGDGVNNEGFGPIEAYTTYPLDGVTVNGLVVDTGAYGDSTELMDFFNDQLKRGRMSFVEVADGFEDYERAMQQKLLRELQVIVVGSAGDRDPKGPNG